MNDIEDRLRDGYLAVERAIHPETIRTNVLPAGSERGLTRFVPLAAAAAVIAVIAGAVTVPQLLTDSPKPVTTPTTPVQAGQSYLADLVPPWIELRAPATGKVLSRTPPPTGYGWQSVVAIDGGRKFLAETAGNPCNGGKPFTIYSLTPGEPDNPHLIITLPGFSLGFTANADGSTLAYLTNQCDGAGAGGPEILSVVRNGTTRDWTMPSSVNPGSLSLSADGSELGYIDTTNQARRGTASVLATSSPSGSLARWSRTVFVPVRHGQQAEALVLSPDGQTTYLLTAPADPSAAMTETLSAYDTTDGSRLRTLHAWAGRYLGYPFMVAEGVNALIWNMHLTSIDEVNLATGIARSFHQLPNGTGDVMAVAW